MFTSPRSERPPFVGVRAGGRFPTAAVQTRQIGSTSAMTSAPMPRVSECMFGPRRCWISPLWEAVKRIWKRNLLRSRTTPHGSGPIVAGFSSLWWNGQTLANLHCKTIGGFGVSRNGFYRSGLWIGP